MSEPVIARPKICLSMIVKNEAHIVGETLDSVAPYISSWVIVDTGSDDGTQDLIRKHMARLGIPGELHERPWRNFGHNRSEALDLARGHGDYIWMVDADDIVVGTPDFARLSADLYRLRLRDGGITLWRPLLFRDGLRWRYEGVIHESPTCDDPYTEAELAGDYHIEYRQLGSRSRDPQKYAHDAEVLLAEVERNPEDVRSITFLAQCYFNAGDHANARKWNARRVEIGGHLREDIYVSMYRLAVSMAVLGEPWPAVQDAFLRAWAMLPTRAEPLYAVARRYREDQEYWLGHLFAQRAASIPLPDGGVFVETDVYAWRAADEQAVCASWIGEHAEAFALCRRLLASTDTPDAERHRITANRDVSVPAMLAAASPYPDAIASGLAAGQRGAQVTVTLVAGPDRGATEQTLNSFLNCCLDVSRVGRFLAVDAGLSAADRAGLQQRYAFLEFVACGPTDVPGSRLAQLHSQIGGRFWLHLGQGWRFFAPENYITRLSTVLATEPKVFQVGINYGDAATLTGTCALESEVRRTPGAGRYVLTYGLADGPAMFDTARLDRAVAAGLRTASLDEVLCTGPSSAPARNQSRKIEHYWLDLPGPNWFCGAPLYARFVGSAQDHDVAVELGSWKGRSASFMGVEIANSGKSIDFYAVDHWRGTPGESAHDHDPDAIGGRLFETFLANIAPVAQYVRPLQSDTAAAASRFADESIDFLYIDAAHDCQGVLRDLEAWFPKVKIGGLICGDDWDFTDEETREYGVRNAVFSFLGTAVDALQIEPSYNLKTGDNWPQWSFRKTSAVSLAVDHSSQADLKA